MSRQPRTEDEIKLARQMRAAGHTCEEIDWALRRRAGSTKRRLKGVDHGHNVRPIHVPDNLSAERDALVAAARDRGAPAQNIFSDPPAAAAVCE
jgi:hypothetical protein